MFAVVVFLGFSTIWYAVNGSMIFGMELKPFMSYPIMLPLLIATTFFYLLETVWGFKTAKDYAQGKICNRLNLIA